MRSYKGLFRHKSQYVLTLIVILGFAVSVRAQNEGVQTQSLDRLVISSIEIAGNKTLSEADIFSKVRARAGEIFSSSVVTSDVKRIAEITGIDSAYYSTDIVGNKIKLTYVVVEQKFVKSIIISGSKKYKAKVLRRKLGFKRGDYFNKFIIETGKEKLEEFYHKKGFALVEISIDQQRLAGGIVVYRIDEGPRARIKKVQFTGNTTISAKKLKKVVKTKKRKYIVMPAYYNPQIISEDILRLQNAYLKRGFLDSKITAESSFTAGKKYAIITFVINEGPVYLADQLIFNGNQYFDDQTLQDGLKLQKGEPYTKLKADLASKSILTRYREIGFIEARVSYSRNFVAVGKVAVDFAIDEGQRFRIGKINVTGNSATRDKVFRRILDEYDFKPGQWYNADMARGDGTGELEKTVKNSSLAESVFITPAEGTHDSKDALVNVAEGRTGMVMLGAGVDSSSGVIGQFVFEQKNFDIHDRPESLHEFITGKAFKGAGQRLRIALEPGTEYSQYSVTFTEPYWRDKPVSLDVAGSRYTRGQESYDEERTKGYLGFEKRDAKSKWRKGIGFRIENVDVDSVDSDAPKEITAVSGGNLLAGVRFSAIKDETDSRFNPTKGRTLSASIEPVIGENDTFGILSGTVRWYKTLYEDLAERKTILETKLRASTILGDAPPFEKFYAGGIGSIRGFDYRGVSTRGKSPVTGLRDDPIGSDWLLLANAEVAIPIGSEVFSYLLFVDAAAIDSGGVRASVGTGIQILIPQWFGPVPMRFEFATPVMKEDDDETQVFSFSIGRLF